MNEAPHLSPNPLKEKGQTAERNTGNNTIADGMLPDREEPPKKVRSDS